MQIEIGPGVLTTCGLDLARVGKHYFPAEKDILCCTAALRHRGYLLLESKRYWLVVSDRAVKGAYQGVYDHHFTPTSWITARLLRGFGLRYHTMKFWWWLEEEEELQ